MCKFFYISTCRYVICVIYNMCNIGASVCILLYSKMQKFQSFFILAYDTYPPFEQPAPEVYCLIERT